MNPTLRNFYTNEAEREAVKGFMIDTLKEMTVDKAFSGIPVAGIKEAAECIDKAFNKLDEIYGKIEASPISNSR